MLWRTFLKLCLISHGTQSWEWWAQILMRMRSESNFRLQEQMGKMLGTPHWQGAQANVCRTVRLFVWCSLLEILFVQHRRKLSLYQIQKVLEQLSINHFKWLFANSYQTLWYLYATTEEGCKECDHSPTPLQEMATVKTGLVWHEPYIAVDASLVPGVLPVIDVCTLHCLPDTTQDWVQRCWWHPRAYRYVPPLIILKSPKLQETAAKSNTFSPLQSCLDACTVG